MAMINDMRPRVHGWRVGDPQDPALPRRPLSAQPPAGSPYMASTTTGGNTPPQMRTMTTGGNTPAMPLATTTAAPQPGTTPVAPLPPFSLPALDGSQYVAQPTPGNAANAPSPSDVVADIGGNFQFTPGQSPIELIQQIRDAFQTEQLPGAADTTMGILDQILNREGSYIANARRRGLEQANARGLMNSSIAAGASQRAATEAAQPILSEAMGLTRQREAQAFQAEQNAIQSAVGLTEQERDAALQQSRDRFAAAMGMTENREQRAFTGQQNSLDRTQSVNNAMLGAELQRRQALLGSRLGREEAILDTQLRQVLQGDAAAQQDWLANNQFTREFNAALSMMPIQSAASLSNMIAQYAMENPEVYTPEIISGMTNFFNRNMLSIMQMYFPEGT